MKNITILFIILFSNIKVESQTIIDISDNTYNYVNNTYYDYYKKDLNNLLDPFQGTYLYTNGNTSFKIILKKMIKQTKGLHFEDMLIGEYQYIVNGTQVANTISNTDVVYSNQFLKHNIAGNGIISKTTNRLWPCPQCNTNEKRVRLSITDVISGRYADLFMRRTTVNGQEVLQIRISNVNTVTWQHGTAEPQKFSLPLGDYTLVKQ